ncbi:unnamed protein product, partial [Closterium sp. NIES-53]
MISLLWTSFTSPWRVTSLPVSVCSNDSPPSFPRPPSQEKFLDFFALDAHHFTQRLAERAVHALLLTPPNLFRSPPSPSQEYYLDFFALDAYHFTLHVRFNVHSFASLSPFLPSLLSLSPCPVPLAPTLQEYYLDFFALDAYHFTQRLAECAMHVPLLTPPHPPSPPSLPPHPSGVLFGFLCAGREYYLDFFALDAYHVTLHVPLNQLMSAIPLLHNPPNPHILQEYYLDFFALDAYHFTLHVPLNVYSFVSATIDLHNTQRVAERSVDALLALCLSLKKRPSIRFQRGSELARRVAHETGRIMYEAEKPLFDFRRTDALPLLLVVDRRDDPVTPLLTQWTYQAMVHELIGIESNKVDLSHVANVSPDQREVVLAAGEDEFFKRHMYDNFGDVGSAVAKLVSDLQSKDRRNKGIQTLDDMAAVLESYPEYRRQAGNVAKHVAIMTELQRVVGSRKLMAVSEVEQELACTSGQTAAFEAVAAKLASQDIADVDKLRLVMLYALRYEEDSPRHLQALINKFSDVCRNPKYKAGLVYTLLRQFGSKRRVADLYGSRDLLNMVARNVKRGLTGVENVYTQHQPLIAQIIDAATKGRLSEADYPFISGNFQQSRSQDLIVFVVGGTTYEEARAVALFNAANPNTRVVLGGTALLNST